MKTGEPELAGRVRQVLAWLEEARREAARRKADLARLGVFTCLGDLADAYGEVAHRLREALGEGGEHG